MKGRFKEREKYTHSEDVVNTLELLHLIMVDLLFESKCHL